MCISCSQKQETFADTLRLQGSKTVLIAKEWEKGELMITEGQNLIVKGKIKTKKGEEFVSEGKALIQKGEDKVVSGNKLKEEASESYKRHMDSVGVTQKVDNQAIEVSVSKEK